MVNYYHRFLPHIAATMAPLYATLTWMSSHAAAFDKAKRAFSDAAHLSFPTPGLPLVLSTDASDIAISAVLKQVLHGAKQPLAFFSRKLLPTESRYSTFDRELLAVYTAIRHLVEGSSFTIQTDHLPLQGIGPSFCTSTASPVCDIRVQLHPATCSWQENSCRRHPLQELHCLGMPRPRL